MYHCKHVNLVRLDVIDDPVRAFHDFPDLTGFCLWNHSTRERKLADLLRPPCQSIHNPLRILGRTLTNIGMNSPKLLNRSISPMNLHFGNPNSARTRSTSVVRPAWLSASPISIA